MKLDSSHNVTTFKDNGVRLSIKDCCTIPALRSNYHTTYNIRQSSPRRG